MLKKLLLGLGTLFYAPGCFGQQTVSLDHWKFRPGDDLAWAAPGINEAGWKSILPGRHWEQQGYTGLNGYAWYRVQFRLPASLKKGALFTDSLRFSLGRIDDHDQAFLNGQLLGQNALTLPPGSGRPEELSKTPMVWDAERHYTIAAGDPRIRWDQENTIAVRVFDEVYDGGIYSLPVEARMMGLSDYLSIQDDNHLLQSNAAGMVRQQLTLQNHSPLPLIKGTLSVRVTSGKGLRLLAARQWPVTLRRDAVVFPFQFKASPSLRMKATWTFTEQASRNTVLHRRESETAGGWVKYRNNPVLGEPFGHMFDVSVLKSSTGTYRMYCSWKDKSSIALSESRDGFKWSDPVVCFAADTASGWENDVNRPVVIEKDGLYHMWYTGQIGAAKTEGKSWIGYAVSRDGKNWVRRSARPVLSPELPWEGVALMSPHVIWDSTARLFKMWYCGGEQIEPNAIGYATSADGLHWDKYRDNPVFTNDKHNFWEQDRAAGCMVIKRTHDYLMFYIGYVNMGFAQIGMARSDDGITGWQRFTENPVIRPGAGFDRDATYKPFPVADPANNRWLLFYNGRRGSLEQMGVAIHPGMDFGF